MSLSIDRWLSFALIIALMGCAPGPSPCGSTITGTEDNQITTHGGYILWPSEHPLSESPQNFGGCTSVIEKHLSGELYVTTALHCVYDLILDQMVFNLPDDTADKISYHDPEILVEFEKSSACSSSEDERISLPLSLQRVTNKAETAEGDDSESSNEFHFTARSEYLSDMQDKLLDVFISKAPIKENNRQDKLTLARAKDITDGPPGIRKLIKDATEYFRTEQALGYSYKGNFATPFMIADPSNPQNVTSLFHGETLKTRSAQEKNFYREACSTAMNKTEFNKKYLLHDLDISRACFLNSDVAIFKLKLSQKATDYLHDKSSCLKHQKDLDLKLQQNVASSHETPSASSPWTGMRQLLSQVFLPEIFRGGLNSSEGFKKYFARQVFDHPKVEYSFHDYKSSNFGVTENKLLFQTKIKWPNLFMLTHLEIGQAKQFTKMALNQRSTNMGSYKAGNLVIVQQRWGLVVFYNNKQYQIKQGVSGALLITAPSLDKTNVDFQQSRLLGTLHSVDDKRTRGWSVTKGSKKINNSFVASGISSLPPQATVSDQGTPLSSTEVSADAGGIAENGKPSVPMASSTETRNKPSQSPGASSEVAIYGGSESGIESSDLRDTNPASESLPSGTRISTTMPPNEVAGDDDCIP